VTFMEIAVIGATGAVGREMLVDLAASAKLSNRIRPRLFASSRSAGAMIEYAGKAQAVETFEIEKLKGIQFALMSAGGQFSREFAEMLVKAGVTVIDNSSAWRMDQRYLLVVPEVNGSLLSKGAKPTIIANPNCSTIQLVVALKPLHDAFGLRSVNVATYQSVSGSGQKGIAELGRQMEEQYKFQEPTPKYYAQPIAFNVLPAIDVLDSAGHCFEEEKVVRETRKIMSLPNLEVMATSARVPTMHCHCEAVTVQLAKKITRAEAIEAIRRFPGIKMVPDESHGTFPTPRSVTGDQAVWVSRVRLPLDQRESDTLQMWIVADNLKKGAATNAVQILEQLIDF
jgi:aspartate-semialdehyde dehydrogenase